MTFTKDCTHLGTDCVNNTYIAGNQVFTGAQSFTAQEIAVFFQSLPNLRSNMQQKLESNLVNKQRQGLELQIRFE
jgi:hypothetical protein